jgi:hypothetical protein
MIRKFDPNAEPLSFTHCPKCDAGSKRLCDTNPLSNETFFASPFTHFENGNEGTKICGECGYEEKYKVDEQ